MTDHAQVWEKILDYAVRYPSPHNSQPIKVKLDGDTMRLYYDLALGLPAESFGIAFGSVCAGVFIECVSVAAHGLGYDLIEHLNYDPINFESTEPLHSLGTLKLVPAHADRGDFDPELLHRRRTSRLPYEPKPVPELIMHELRAEAEAFGYTLHDTTEPKLVRDVILVNQRTLFYDLAEPHVRREIQGYLRYSKREAKRLRDGLSAECLDLPGPLMRLLMGNYWVWNVPLLGNLIKKVYLNSMNGVAHIAWMVGPFKTIEDYTRAGRAFLRVWLRLTQHRLYLHPFGSVITNARAHREFVQLVGEDENGGMAWMLFRLGQSKTPPVAYRRHVKDMVI